MRQRSFLLFTLVAAILVAGIFASTARATDDTISYARIVRLSYATGDVQIVRGDASANWEAAYANMPIQQGFTIGTNNGFAEVEFEHGSALWMGKNSVLQFTELALSDGGRITRMTLTQGTATFEASLQPGDSFVVSAPQFQITAPAKSTFRVDAFKDANSVSVQSGKVSISSSAGTQDVPKGETFSLNATAPGNPAIKTNPARDSWDRWVSGREDYLSNGSNETLQYSSSPYSYGTADLSSYGGWNYVAGCGYGWQPYGMSSGWMPFYNGQWMMYPSLGWTWVSFEPWGWAPYHFGNWANCGGSGWMWFPGENGFWNAGAVQWFGVGKRIGWRPFPRVNPPHAAAAPVVLATKNLGKEGRYEVMPAAKISNDLRELPAPPLADGKIPTAAAATQTQASGGGGLAPARVFVPTASSLGGLRLGMAGGASGARTVVNGAAPPNAPRTAGAPGTIQQAALVNATPPAPMKVPSAPPVRTATFAPSQPGQASARPPSFDPSRGWSGSSASSSSSSRSESGSASRAGSAPSSAPASAPASSSGGGGRPH
jgi:hypothetical protein